MCDGGVSWWKEFLALVRMIVKKSLLFELLIKRPN